MDFRGPVSETFTCSPIHAYTTAMELDKNYEGALASSWKVDHTEELYGVFAQIEKRYDEVEDVVSPEKVFLDPNQTVSVSPFEDTGLEVEIDGVLNIDPEKFLRIIG